MVEPGDTNENIVIICYKTDFVVQNAQPREPIGDNVSFQDFEERELEWEQREVELERIIAQMERTQAEIAGAATQVS